MKKPKRNLSQSHPQLIYRWHPTKNGDKKPEDFTYGSKKKVWWLCPKNKNHDFESPIWFLTHSKSAGGCPFCAGKKVSEDNSLAFLFPEIAKEWHPTKNGDKKPEDFTHGSKKKVWWLCPKKHTYSATLSSRTGMKSGCGKCSPQSSSQNVRIYSEIQFLFDKDELKYNYRVEGWEMDLFIPKINLAIEYDGYHWHKDNEERDLRKNQYLVTKKIKLLRLREKPLSLLTKSDLSLTKGKIKKSDINNIARFIGKLFPKKSPIQKKIAYYIKQKNFINEDIYKNTLAVISLPDPSKSIINTHPEIAKEWDYKKNYPLLPDHYTQGSHENIWWKCKICENSYQSQISDKTRLDRRQRKCPQCKN